jgi:hypothetical protein
MSTFVAAWMPGQSMTLTNPGLESLKAGGPLSEDLFAGDTPVPASNGELVLLRTWRCALYSGSNIRSVEKTN